MGIFDLFNGKKEELKRVEKPKKPKIQSQKIIGKKEEQSFLKELKGITKKN